MDTLHYALIALWLATVILSGRNSRDQRKKHDASLARLRNACLAWREEREPSDE